MKKILAITLTLAMILSLMSVASFTVSAETIGDVDDDGDVTMRDVLYVRKLIVGAEILISINESLADVNRDGSTDMLDVLLMRKYIVGMTNDFTTNSYGIPSSESVMTLTVDQAVGVAGEYVKVNFVVNENKGFWGLSLNVTYDTSVLRLKSLEAGSRFISQLGLMPVEAGAESFTINVAGNSVTENCTTNGVLATATFLVAPNAAIGTTAAIEVTYDTCNQVDVSRHQMPIVVHNGSVRVVSEDELSEYSSENPYFEDGLVISVDNVIGDPGEEVAVSFVVDQNSGFWGLSFDVCYDASALTLKSVTFGSAFVNEFGFLPVEAGTEPFKITGAENSLNKNCTATGVLATAIFKIAANAPAGTKIDLEITFKDDWQIDVDMNDVPLTVRNGSVTVSGEPSEESSVESSEDPGEETSADIMGTCGPNLTWRYNESTSTLTISGVGKMYDYDGTHSNGTRNPWVSYGFHEDITSIIIADGVISIGNSAFDGCRYLTDIIIPNSVTSIGEFSFADCRYLTSIKIPKSVISIGQAAFLQCVSLTSITIPYGVTEIEMDTFSDCDSLTSIVIPDSVTSIGLGAFQYCDALMNVTLSNGLISIDDMAFSCCDSLASIAIPNGVTSIGYQSFAWCDNLSRIIIPDSLVDIGEGSFAGSTWFDQQPDGMVYAGKVAYDYKGDWSGDVVIREGTLGIADSIFAVRPTPDAPSVVNNIIIPASVTHIGFGAFHWNTPRTVYYGGTQTDRDKIVIEESNDGLLDTTWIYEYHEMEFPKVNSNAGTGDADGDGETTMKDVLKIRKFIAGMGGDIDEDAADVNRDGSVDMKDVLMIRKFIAGLIDKFPRIPA